MRISKKFLVWMSLICSMVFGFTACGQQDKGDAAESSAEVESPAQKIQPDIGTNVPPPESKNETSNETSEDTAQKFFENKKSYDQFSEGLKAQVYQSYSTQPIVAPGVVVYNTLLGPVTPGETQTTVLYELKEGEAPAEGCNPVGPFLCLDSPEDGFETVQPGIDVIAKIDLNSLAVFSASDPVAVVSVFNNSTGGSASEIPIMPADVQSTSNPDVGKFSAAVGLGGAGKFTILVSAYKVDSTGANELVSIVRTGTRIEAPRTEFVEAKPNPANYLAEPSKRKDPVANGAVIASEALDIKIKLLSAGGNGVQTRFESYDDKNVLQSVAVAVPQESGDIVGKVYLHQGLNKIKIVSRAPALEAQMGESAPEPVVLEFNVFNAWGGPRTKILKPLKAGVIAQTAADQKVDVQFCFTFVPSKTQGSAGGAGGVTPTLEDECVTGSLGFSPVVTVNGRQIGAESDPKHDTLEFNGSTGIFTAHITPDFGVNLVQVNGADVIASDQPVDSKNSSTAQTAFVFGVPMPIFKDGKLNQIKDFPQFTNFTKRGLQIDIDKSMIEGPVKELLIEFLNKDSTHNLLLDNFKSVANKPGYVCQEYLDPNTGKPIVSNGDTTINFLKETFALGNIELTGFKTTSNGVLEIGLKIHGMHGEADLRAAESEGGNTFNGMDLGFLPITFSISELEANLGVAFPKKSDIDLNKDGVMEARSVLDLRQIPDKTFLKITGDGPLGRPVYVNSARNPMAQGIELLDWQQGLLLTQFNAILGGTLLCGVEAGLNNEASGAFGKSVVDLEKLVSYDNNIFRLPLNFEIALLGKALNLDVAYNLLKGDIKLDSLGLHIRNVPLRMNPGPATLNNLLKDPLFAAGEIGAVSRFKPATEPSPESSFTSAKGNASVQIGEDGINQAMFGAVLSGLLDLNVDANFYTTGKLTPADRLTPSGKDLAPGMDVNQDGLIDRNDELTPVALEVRPNKLVPPTVSFLTQEEVSAFVKDEEEFNSSGAEATPDANPDATPEAEVQTYFKEDGQYFRVSLADVEIAAYRNEPVAESLGGISKYCKVRWEDPPSVAEKGFCPLAADAFIDSAKYPNLCAGKDLISIPRLNGDKVSQQVTTAENVDKPVPLYRIKLGVVLHGKITGVDREISSKEKLTNPAAVEKTILHVQFAPSVVSKKALQLSVEVVENNTGASDAQVVGIFDTIVRGGFGDRCFGLNEIRVPIPGKIEGKIPEGGTEPADLLPDFGIESLDLGGDSGNLPSAFIDDSRLYLDILLFAGLNFSDDTGDNGTATTGGK